MKYGIALIIFGLTQPSVAMDQQHLPSLPAPSLLVQLVDIQQKIELLQRHNEAEVVELRECLEKAANNPEINGLQTRLSITIARLRNGKDLLDGAREKLMAIRLFAAGSDSQHKRALTLAPGSSDQSTLCSSCKRRKIPQEKDKEWDMRPYRPRPAATSRASSKE